LTNEEFEAILKTLRDNREGIEKARKNVGIAWPSDNEDWMTISKALVAVDELLRWILVKQYL
jgi:hypothetical protein